MFSDPQHIVNQIPVMPGMVIADLGAGTGVFSFPLASKTGPTGKVYACDVQKDMLVRLDNEIRERHVTNIQTVLSNVETHQGTRLRDMSIDMVVVANVLFQIEDRPGFVDEIKRILKIGGIVLVVDWSESFGNLGPHENHVINRLQSEKLFSDHGFHILPQLIDAGSHHYGLLLKK